MTTPTTLAEWEAAKERIDALRSAYVAGGAKALDCVGRSISGVEMWSHAEKRFPYPSKPERTVRIKDHDYRCIDGRVEARNTTSGAILWTAVGWTSDDVRLLASLLEEEGE